MTLWKRFRRMLHLWRHTFNFGKDHQAEDFYYLTYGERCVEISCKCGRVF